MTWVEVFTGWISHIDKDSSPDSWGGIQEIPPLSPGHQTFLTILLPLTQFQCPGLLMLLREGLRLEGSCAVRERQCHHDHCFILWNFRCANPDWSSDFGIALDVFFFAIAEAFYYTLTLTILAHMHQFSYAWLTSSWKPDLTSQSRLQTIHKRHLDYCVPSKSMKCQGECFGKCIALNWFLGGGFKYFLFSPVFGEDFPFD